MTARAGYGREGEREAGPGLRWVFVCVCFGAGEQSFWGKRQGSGVQCEHQDSQGSVYKVCLLDFHCYSNYKLRFSHTAALAALVVHLITANTQIPQDDGLWVFFPR